ncbi:MAG: hypothetical protein WD708_03280 [Kiritimatiellia bacterium]
MPPEWRAAVWRTRVLVNLGWMWWMFSRLLVATAGVCALLWWLLRLRSQPAIPVWILGGLSLFASLAAARNWAERKWMTMEQTCARLDSGWGLENRLVSALRGAGAWPMYPPNRALPLRWRLEACVIPPALSLAFVGLAAFLPLPPPQTGPDFKRAEPPEWRSMQSLTGDMREEQWVEEEAVRSIQEELNRLREKPMESWYTPSSLEATDQLRTRLRRDAERLTRGMERTSSLLGLADQGRSLLSDSQKQQMQEMFQQLRGQMAEGGLPMNPELLGQLREMDLSQLQGIDSQQLQMLEQQLAERSQAMREALRAAGLLTDEADILMPGGVEDDAQTAPLTLEDFANPAQAAVPVALNPGDLTDSAIGDLVELRQAEHEEDREAIPTRAGGLSNRGGDGEVVWDQDVLPEEEKVLKQYFQ